VWGGSVADCQEKMSLFFSSSYFLVELTATARAQEMTKVLKEKYDLHLVTSRQHKLEEITRIWIKHNFPDTFTEIHFGNHYCEPGQKSIPKSELCLAIKAVLLIDDNVSYAIDCSDHNIPVILFGDYAWNRTQVLSEKNSAFVRRVASWDGVPAAIDWALTAVANSTTSI
jgi:5'(3')-deoxyribonucleotidase